MSDIQQVVDELRFILQREVIEQTDELTRLVAEYSRLCHDVNVRLRRCDDCVKQGLRSEALHLAESKPNLLDAVAILDFPERNELNDIVSLYFMTPPEPLLIDVATALNEAYAEHEPLEKLLDIHRLLALGRAPLAQRLSVLRSLADLDTLSPHWDQDIREMERARFRELEAESVAATKSGNAEALNTLVSEIRMLEWREAIPASLSRNLKARATHAVRGNARQRMEELSEQLFAAFSALDVSTAQPLREEWKQNRRLVQVDENDPLVERVKPVLNWLDDEDRKASDTQEFAKITADIERALDDDDITVEDLNRLQLAADRYERRLPSTLEMRFRSRLGTLRLNDVRRKKLIVGAGIGAFAIVAGIFGFIIYLSMEGEKTRRLVAAAASYIDDGKLGEAQKLIDQYAAQSTSEAWLGIKRRMADAEQSERDRIANWKAQIATARESEDLILIEAALKQARELAKTTDEKIELGQLQSTWQKRVHEATAERERVFREAITSASNELKALDAALASTELLEPSRFQSLLDSVEIQMARLLPDRGSVSKELGSQATLLESRFKASQQTVADLTRKAEIFDKLNDAVLMLPEDTRSTVLTDRYETILAEFITALPNDPRVAAIKVAAESSPFPAVLAFQKMIKRWGHLNPVDKTDVETRLREIRTFFSEHPQSPDRELVAHYEAFLASVLRRFEDDGDPDEGIQRRLFNLFNGKFIKEANVLRDNEGNTYYLQKTPKFGSLTNIYYLTGFNGESDNVSLKSENLLTPTPVAAPHQEIAAKARTMIRSTPIDRWRDNFHELITALLKADKVDSFLRYLLVLKTLEFAGRGDLFLETELSPILEALNDDEIDRSVPWMDPKNKSAIAARSRASEHLSTVSIDSMGTIFTAASKRQGQFEHTLFAPRFSVGWLEKTPHGQWVCHTKWSPPGQFTLFVVTRADTNGVRSWTELGNVHDKSTTIAPDVAQSVGEGAVVFASAKTQEATTKSTRNVPSPANENR